MDQYISFNIKGIIPEKNGMREYLKKKKKKVKKAGRNDRRGNPNHLDFLDI